MKRVTGSELAQNDGIKSKSLWMCIDSVVYDLSGFNHPGG